MRRRDRDFLRAARSGHVDRLERFLEEGADVNLRGQYEYTALLWAACSGHEDAVRWLVAKGADVNARAHDNATALYFAVARRHPGIVRILLDAGADPNTCRDTEWGRPGDTPGASPLHSAVWHGDEDIARMLLDAGARTDHVRWGRDVLAAAKDRGLDDLLTHARRRKARRR